MAHCRHTKGGALVMYDDTEPEGTIEEDEDLLLEEEEGQKEFNPNSKYTSEELVAFADKILREDSNRELCRKCKEKNSGADYLPYGEETGMVESVPQFAADNEPLLDDEGNQLYLDFPELQCAKRHRWFQGEGQRRDIRGPNPILFESHLYNRKRREIYVEAGTPDPAFTMDRKGRPTQGMYNRAHPEGRKINTKDQRAKNGASYYRAYDFLPLIYVIIHAWHYLM
jgi:hypothetical protein